MRQILEQMKEIVTIPGHLPCRGSSLLNVLRRILLCHNLSFSITVRDSEACICLLQSGSFCVCVVGIFNILRYNCRTCLCTHPVQRLCPTPLVPITFCSTAIQKYSLLCSSYWIRYLRPLRNCEVLEDWNYVCFFFISRACHGSQHLEVPNICL